MSGHGGDARLGKGMRFALVLASLGLLVTLGYVILGNNRAPAEESSTRAPGLRGNKLPTALVNQSAPRIRLTDAYGKLIDTEKLKGQPYLVTFLYTRCPDICPIIGQEIREALDQLDDGEKNQVSVLAVSVDPEGDTPDTVRRWLKRQHLSANVKYVLGSKKQLEPVWKGYFVLPQTPGRPQASTHTASIWLIDKSGHRRTSFSGGVAVAPADLAHDIRVLISEPIKAGAYGASASGRTDEL